MATALAKLLRENPERRYIMFGGKGGPGQDHLLRRHGLLAGPAGL
jgi:hypothetical protein